MVRTLRAVRGGGGALPAEVREAQARAALIEMGSSVVTGITITKLVGVTILAIAPSQLFRLYYFREYWAPFLRVFFYVCSALVSRQPPPSNTTLLFAGIYLGIIVTGAFHGLMLLPVLLASCGMPDP